MLSCRISRKEQRAVITLQRFPANAFNLEYLRNLGKLIKHLERNEHIHTVIIESGCKNVFSSGLDLSELIRTNAWIQYKIAAAVASMYRITRAITKSKKIYIASLKGPVIGSAVSLAMACDFRFGEPSVWFWLPDPLYGGLLADGGIDFINKQVGCAAAKRICITNERINVTRLYKLGIADKSEIDSKTAAADLAERLSGYSNQTLWHTKKLINKNLMRGLTLIRLLKICTSRELKERLEKNSGKVGQA